MRIALSFESRVRSFLHCLWFVLWLFFFRSVSCSRSQRVARTQHILRVLSLQLCSPVQVQAGIVKFVNGFVERCATHITGLGWPGAENLQMCPKIPAQPVFAHSPEFASQKLYRACIEYEYNYLFFFLIYLYITGNMGRARPVRQLLLCAILSTRHQRL